MKMGSNQKEYVIVDFPEESKDGAISMALISSSWLFEKDGMSFCYWPGYLKSTLSRERAVKNHISLILEKCIECAVEVKMYTSDYEKAITELRRLEDESEQSTHTDEEDITLTANIYKDKHRDSDFFYYETSDFGDDEEDLPIPPKLPSKVTPKKFVTLKPVELSQERLTMSQSTNSQKSIPNNKEQPNSQVQNNKDETRELHQQGVCQSEKCLKILERVLRDIQILKADVKILVQMANNDKLTEYQTLDCQLSFTNYDDLQNFNLKLSDQDYFNKMLHSICLLGGRDVQDTTRKILTILINHDLALKINWIGANEKGSFQKLDNVLKLIYVRRNPICSIATNSEIDTVIKSWIKNAPDRAGGRAIRKKKQTNPIGSN